MKRGLYLVLIYALIFRQQQKNKVFFEAEKTKPIEKIIPSNAVLISTKWRGNVSSDVFFARKENFPKVVKPIVSLSCSPAGKDDTYIRKSYLASQ